MLDRLSDSRDALGAVADHLSLGVAFETLWIDAERCEAWLSVICMRWKRAWLSCARQQLVARC